MPVIRSSTQTPRHSPRKHRSALQPAPAPLTPPVANTDRPHEDLLQKVTQVLEFFEREVARAQEEKQAAVDARVAAEKAEADAKVAEEVIQRKPVEVDAAKHMICAVNAILGAPAGQIDSGPFLQDDDIWADVFYEADDH
ncbi:hypothetical protein PISMIDRAFT_17904 [Pisolithus microcarpus 441]|uniref:Uncharacterized protein n=1 Tax=Pisolithus microcarpus 441 TaxID=765257 RepID=A0A0C9YTF1_9AGAM|nr:hypothetical protein PISMIDRAFT_17904 [Pisolithus microcarpus 441]